jgi:hypothetical protein
MDEEKLATDIARRMRSATSLKELELLQAYRAAILKEAADRAVEWLYPESGIYDCSMSSAKVREERKAALRAAIEGRE